MLMRRALLARLIREARQLLHIIPDISEMSFEF